MKAKLLLALSLFVFQLGFSQTEKLLKGVVSSENFLLNKVDVINKNSKKSTPTNEKGEFIIAVKPDDSLLFYIKDFKIKRLKVSSKQIESNNLEVTMFKNAEELDEVVVAKMHTIKLSQNKAYEQSKRDEYATEKYDKNEGYQAMRRGTFVNGLNFVAIGKLLLGMFSKDKEPKIEAQPETEFVTLAKNTCDQKFYLETLKLKPEEIDLFLQFCDLDPKSKKAAKDNNILSMMDFLSAKNIEFQKLKN